MQKKWIWQSDNYPYFQYDLKRLLKKLSDIRKKQGYLEGIIATLDETSVKEHEIETLSNEAVNTFAIEGETIRRESVRSSILKKLHLLNPDYEDHSSLVSDHLVEVLLDAHRNFKKPLTHERLFGWHNALFPTGYSGLLKINVAKYRDEPITVVSGYEGREKIKFEALPVEQIQHDMDSLLYFLDDYEEDGIILAGIAHLWFLIIHPFDDGNGRIARAINDYLIAKESHASLKLYSISTAIMKRRKEYYAVLDRTTNIIINKEADITEWLEWYLDILSDALAQTDIIIERIKFKTQFWDTFREKALNSRQIKVLNKILDIGVEAYEGGLTSRKYKAIAKTTDATAKRDIQELLDFGCIVKIEGRGGRSTAYIISI